jgi:hypothetical protein
MEILEDRTAPAGRLLGAPGVFAEVARAAALSVAVAAPQNGAHADFNGDKRPDLATLGDGTVSVLLARNERGQRPLRLSVGASPRAIIAADFNGDGILDLAVANKASKDVSILIGRGNGSFQDEARFSTDGVAADVILAGDFAGNGNLDLAGVDLETNQVFVLVGNGDGTFQMLVPTVGVERNPNTRKYDALRVIMLPSPVSERESFLRDGGVTPSTTPDLLFDTLAGGGAFDPSDLAGEPTDYPSETAALLTSFGTVVPLVQRVEEHTRLTELFVVNGPGFATAVHILQQGDSSENGREDIGAPFVTEFMPRETPTWLPTDPSALSSLNMSVEDALRPDRFDGLPGSNAPQFEQALPKVEEIGIDALHEGSPSAWNQPQTLDTASPAESMVVAMLALSQCHICWEAGRLEGRLLAGEGSYRRKSQPRSRHASP